MVGRHILRTSGKAGIDQLGATKGYKNGMWNKKEHSRRKLGLGH